MLNFAFKEKVTPVKSGWNKSQRQSFARFLYETARLVLSAAIAAGVLRDLIIFCGCLLLTAAIIAAALKIEQEKKDE